jgi:hypothetical protein
MPSPGGAVVCLGGGRAKARSAYSSFLILKPSLSGALNQKFACGKQKSAEFSADFSFTRLL